jgi:diguanylate cyclase (GGDEF)-like protein
MVHFAPMLSVRLSRAVATACTLFALATPQVLRAALPGVTLSPQTDSIPLGRYVEVLEDRSGALDIDDIRGAAQATRFAPSAVETPNFGYTRSVVWLRFRVANPLPRRENLLLELGYPTIDEADLYYPVSDRSGAPHYAVKRGGDTQPFSAREIEDRNPVFRLALEPDSAQTYYLRIRSLGVLTAPLSLWRTEAFHAHKRSEQLLYGLFYGGALALLLYNVMLYLSLRDRAYLYYVLYAAAFALFLLSYDGYATQYLWPEGKWLADHAILIALALTLAFSALFARRFLDMPHTAPAASAFLGSAGAVGFVLSLFGATGWLMEYGLIPRAVSMLSLPAAAVTLWVSVRESRRGYRPAKFFLLAWSALLAFIMLTVLRNFALAPANFVTLNGLHIGFALDIVLLSFALADRINEMKLEAAGAQAEALTHQRALLEKTLESERDLERRIAERTAELNRANERLRAEAAERDALMAQLREREEHLRYMAQHDPLTGLPNRTSMQQRLALAVELAKRNRKKVAVMLVDLNDFKLLNDTRGHTVGDRALITVAERLRSSVRASDTVARYGGDEFVVLAGELDRIEDAEMIAEKIADMIGVAMSIEGGTWTIGCSIGISVYPDNAEEGETLIALADQAMYASKSKKTIRYAFYEER